MWWTQTPKPMKAVIIVASATQVYATMGRRASVGITWLTIPRAGSTMM